MDFPDKSKKKHRKIDFSFVSAHSASLMKTGSKLGEGGGRVCISLVGTGPRNKLLKNKIRTLFYFSIFFRIFFKSFLRRTHKNIGKGVLPSQAPPFLGRYPLIFLGWYRPHAGAFTFIQFAEV